MPSDYRLAPQVSARLLGASLLFWGVLVFLVTAVVVLLTAPVWLLSTTVVLCLVGVFGTGYWLTKRLYVVRLGEDGYQVRFIRGAGVTRARWVDVQDVVTATVSDEPCVVLRLKDGRATTIPVEALAVDREQFVRDLQAHLDRGHGLRKLR